ncbi:MAG: AAA-like domain-containing protein [Marinilabiliaceae bacterium]|nr:AAA-like domain-containing protein [Marinilabiliaceae bacterium]
MRKFNVTGNCVPNMHYMVDISEKVEQIFQMVEGAKYFTINRGRQYGKTTTIGRLKKRLIDEGSYICASISFQYSNDKMFENEGSFCQGLLSRINRSLMMENKEEALLWLDDSVTDFWKLSKFISKRCKEKKIVLIINEVDEAANYNLFVRFLQLLREKFQMRTASRDYTFHSVILVSVRDVKNLDYVSGDTVRSSPWNIASNFDIDMSFSAPEIETILIEYENDHHTGMDISEIANEIRFYTNGYPYLVSRICQFIDTDLDRNWTIDGVQDAIKMILKENSAFFAEMFNIIEENEDFRNLLFDLTFANIYLSYNPHDPVSKTGLMYSYLGKQGYKLAVHNKIFEIRITNYFIVTNLRKWRETNLILTPVSEIVKDGIFNMELCLTRFNSFYSEIYTAKDLKFLERDGKLIFLTYLKPLINGFGFYHFESETRDFGRMDLVVDFLKQQFIIELKLWYGSSKHEDAYDQLANYLKSKNMECGYLITYDFRKKRDPLLHETQWVNWKGKRIFDVILRVGEEE